MRIYAIVTAAVLVASAAPADAGIIAHLAEKQQAKRELKQFFRSNPDLAVYRKGQLGLKSAAVKLGTLAAAGTVELGGLYAAVDRALSIGGGGGELVAGTIFALGVGVGGWKLAGVVKRAATTRTLEYALAQGRSITPDQLARWRAAGLIGALRE